ncbi:Hypothetical_protein [Hexamita inflata]|uniref:Hypothetical_protein n=1 Tax=Hexamita inflata TaxID=28002 RepID=A0ABP1GJ46_9EUKA
MRSVMKLMVSFEKQSHYVLLFQYLQEILPAIWHTTKKTQLTQTSKNGESFCCVLYHIISLQRILNFAVVVDHQFSLKVLASRQRSKKLCQKNRGHIKVFVTLMEILHSGIE